MGNKIEDIGTSSTGKEVVLLEKSEFGDGLFLFEMKRFDEHGGCIPRLLKTLTEHDE